MHKFRRCLKFLLFCLFFFSFLPFICWERKSASFFWYTFYILDFIVNLLTVFLTLTSKLIVRSRNLGASSGWSLKTGFLCFVIPHQEEKWLLVYLFMLKLITSFKTTWSTHYVLRVLGTSMTSIHAVIFSCGYAYDHVDNCEKSWGCVLTNGPLHQI